MTRSPESPRPPRSRRPHTLPRTRVRHPLFIRGQEQAFANQLNTLLRQSDPAALLAVLGLQARAHGMSALAKHCGVTREGLYRALKGDAKPRFETVVRVMQALGFELIARPAPGVAGDSGVAVNSAPETTT